MGTKDRRYAFLFCFMFFFSCSNHTHENTDKWKQEILETEREFSEMTDSAGIKEAFAMFSADEAVLLRNSSLIIGKQNLIKYFEAQEIEDDVRLSWKPDFVDVSSSGDLGYTYGYYTYFYTDSIGNPKEIEGIFHTVWKRQPDGSWKFVWD